MRWEGVKKRQKKKRKKNGRRGTRKSRGREAEWRHGIPVAAECETKDEKSAAKMGTRCAQRGTLGRVEDETKDRRKREEKKKKKSRTAGRWSFEARGKYR